MTVARLTQEATEALSTVAPNARLSQETVEALSAGNPSARLSQQAVEVPIFGCHVRFLPGPLDWITGIVLDGPDAPDATIAGVRYQRH